MRLPVRASDRARRCSSRLLADAGAGLAGRLENPLGEGSSRRPAPPSAAHARSPEAELEPERGAPSSASTKAQDVHRDLGASWTAWVEEGATLSQPIGSSAPASPRSSRPPRPGRCDVGGIVSIRWPARAPTSRCCMLPWRCWPRPRALPSDSGHPDTGASPTPSPWATSRQQQPPSFPAVTLIDGPTTEDGWAMVDSGWLGAARRERLAVERE